MSVPGSALWERSHNSHRGAGGNDEAGLGKEQQDCISHGFQEEGGSLAFHVRPLVFYTRNEA